MEPVSHASQKLKAALATGDSSILKARLEGKLSSGQPITSADVADFTQPKTSVKPVEGTVKVPVPPAAAQDPMIKAAAEGNPGEKVSKDVADTAKTERLTSRITDESDEVLETIEITEEERNLFLDSVVTGKRFMLPFTLFDGRITGKLRSRSQHESQAILARLHYEVSMKRLVTALDYSTRLRNMVLAAQVEELRETRYTVLQEPLLNTKGADETVEPGWLRQVETWEQEHEGLASALYAELQRFEQKYWTMVRSAGDQNFWHPAESTSA